MRVAFVGLGVMGYPMAGYLVKAGHEVTVYQSNHGKGGSNGVAEYGGIVPIRPDEAAAGAEIVFVCVGNDDDVRAVILGDGGILPAYSAGGIIVDHTTASAVVAREVCGGRRRKGRRFPRCAAVRRPGRRRKRAADDHGGRKRRDFRSGLPRSWTATPKR